MAGITGPRYAIPILLMTIIIFTFSGCVTSGITETEGTPVIDTLPPTNDITPTGVETLPMPETSTEETESIETTPVETIPATTISSGTTPTPTPEQVIVDITAAEAYDLIQANKNNPDFVIIDIRTPEEFEQGHLENAILINYRADDFNDEISRLDRGKKYLIYCRTGNRTFSALEIMKEMGFLHVYHMSKGITEWTAQGLPVAK